MDPSSCLEHTLKVIFMGFYFLKTSRLAEVRVSTMF